MLYVQRKSRDQIHVSTLESAVEPDSLVRLIDAFVGSLYLSEMGFTQAEGETGRPMYDPKSILKLYMWGTRNRYMSSRRLEMSCRKNVDVMWLMHGTAPDYRTIARFRAENAESVKKVFPEFNRRISSVTPAGYSSVDGTKFRANSSAENTKTKEQPDAALKREERQITKIPEQMDRQIKRRMRPKRRRRRRQSRRNSC